MSSLVSAWPIRVPVSALVWLRLARCAPHAPAARAMQALTCPR